MAYDLPDVPAGKVLGGYKFGHGITMYHALADMCPGGARGVEIHESIHLHLCRSTPFGIVQDVLGLLISFRDKDCESYKAALHAMALRSWAAHEGLATYGEMSSAALRGQEHAVAIAEGLRPDYRAAAGQVGAIMRHLAIPLASFGPIIDAVGFVVMGTQILAELIDFDVFLKTDWESYFSLVDNSPDARLSALAATMQSTIAIDAVGCAFWDIVERYHKHRDENRFLDSLQAMSFEEHLAFNDEVRGALIGAMAAHVPFGMADDATTPRHASRLCDLWVLGQGRIPPTSTITELQGRERLRHVLDKLNYISPASPLPHGMVCIGIEHVAGHLRRSNAATYYASIWHTEAECEVGTEPQPLHVKAGGGILLVHSCEVDAGRFNFECPVRFAFAYDGRAPLGVLYSPGDKHAAWGEAVRQGAIVSIHERRMAMVCRERPIDEVVGECEPPIIVYPTASTLCDWERTLAIAGENVWGFYGNAGELSGYLIVVARAGRVAYARPTSSMIFYEFLEKGFGERVVRGADGLKTQFGAEWSERLAVAVAHYNAFGW